MGNLAMPASTELTLTTEERVECVVALLLCGDVQDQHARNSVRWPCSGAPFREAARLLADGKPLPRVECRLLLNAVRRKPLRDYLITQFFTIASKS